MAKLSFAIYLADFVRRSSLRRAKADGVGFEPTMHFRACRFSKPVPSTTQPPIPWSTEARVLRDAKETIPKAYHFLPFYQKMLWYLFNFCFQFSFEKWKFQIENSPLCGAGPIVYRLGHVLFKHRSGVRLSVGSHSETCLTGTPNPRHKVSLYN